MNNGHEPGLHRTARKRKNPGEDRGAGAITAKPLNARKTFADFGDVGKCALQFRHRYFVAQSDDPPQR